MKTFHRQLNPLREPTRRDGFTLLDLSVVLAVIAMLLTLQISALSTTKDDTRIAQCASNLRQFALAMQIYGNENNDNLPSNSGGAWAWDMSWAVGNTITQWVSSRVLYCPGTAVRFSEADNNALWNYVPFGLHITGYALTLAGNPAVTITNQNSKLTPQSISGGTTLLPPPSPARRVLVADSTISSSGYAYSQRYTYNWTVISGGFVKPHISAHVKGQFPVGGNLGMLDGHVAWRKFDDMECRVSTGPGFWW